MDAVITSIWEDLQQHPGTTYRIVLRDTEPQEPELSAVLQRCASGTDPGPVFYGLASTRLRFDTDKLLTSDPWQEVLSEVTDEAVRQVCDALVVEVDLPAFSLDVRRPGPAEQTLLRRVSDELGAGRPPNRNRSPEEVALSLIEAATRARSLDGTITAPDLIPRLDLTVDFGAVHEGHPVDPTTAIARPSTLQVILNVLDEAAATGETVTVVGGPGAGKSWLCEQLADQLDDAGWLVARHHCWLGATDIDRDERVLTDVVIGSLLRQLEAAAPAAVAGLRPRYAATRESLAAALAAIHDATPDRRLALIVDGLDHVTRVLGRTEGAALSNPPDPARLLVDELAAVELPAGTALLIASQPGEHLASIDGKAVSLPPLTRGEVRDLADRLGLLTAFEPDPGRTTEDRLEAVVDFIHTRSRGNALYATYLCRQALRPAPMLGQDSVGMLDDPLDRLQRVPASAGDLDEYYEYLLSGLTGGQRMAVSLLAICDFAVRPDDLREIFPGIQLIQSALTTIAPIVVQQPGLGGLRIHHESFSRFVRTRTDAGSVAQVRSAAAEWLAKRGFFTDSRAFRHLPELLVALGRDDELSGLIAPDFVTHAIAWLQPPAAITHVLIVVARRAAATLDWPLLVRCVELRGAAYTYEADEIPATLVRYASVVVALVGADAVAASLVYDGVPTVEARWGLQLCAAVDAAGAAAPWETYLDTWEGPGRRNNTDYGPETEDDLNLALQLGYLRLPDRDSDSTFDDETAVRGEQRLADHLGSVDLPPLPRLLGVFIAGLGAPFVLAAARLVIDPARRAELLLHLADIAAAGNPGLPDAHDLAVEAWQSSPTTDLMRMVRHGIGVDEVVEVAVGADIDAALQELTTAVLQEVASTRPQVVRQWLTVLNLAQAKDRNTSLRILPRLEGEGFYRAWLRFAATTTGLGRDVTTGATNPVEASAIVRVAFEQLAHEADHFTGNPRACDLWSIHSLVHEVVEDAIALLTETDFDDALRSLVTISDNTTASLMGMAGSGPLTMNDLLTILSRTVNAAAAATVRQLMDQLRTDRETSNYNYSEFAVLELEMARICLTAGDRDEARRCWERSARYSACYGSHKDLTLLELLDPLPTLATVDLHQAQIRLARVQDLTYLVTQHTDGRETRHLPRQWWELLAALHPEAAAVLAAQLLLDEPDVDDSRVDAAHHQLLSNQTSCADPVIMAALRIAAGARGRDLDIDITLLTRLHAVPTDDLARVAETLPLIANAITATYDDQPLLYASGEEKGARPTTALSDAATRIGGEGLPCYQATPRHKESAQQRLPSRSGNPVSSGQDLRRPEFHPGSAGVLAAVRRYISQRYDSNDTSPRWDSDALINRVGWHLLHLAESDGQDAAIRLLHRIADEFSGLSDSTVLADIAVGLDLRRADNHEQLDRLASTAYALAFTKIRGGGGWRTFAGRDRLDLWQRSAVIDVDTATTTLANQILARIQGRGFEVFGITQALVAAFAAHSPDPAHPPQLIALACWDAAMDVIAYRIPGAVNRESGAYEPESPLPTGGDIDQALSRLALATIALPDRADRRRALVAATVLLAARPAVAQTALSHVLTASLGAGPLTWLLSVIRDGLRDGGLVATLAGQLDVLARCDLLSVRALAAEILEAAGRQVPDPPATAAHRALLNAVAEAMAQEP